MGTACSWGQYQHWNPDAGMLVTKGVTWPWRNELQRLIFSLHSWVCLHQVNGMLTHNRFWKLGKNIGWFFVIERVDLQYQKRECWVKPHFLRFEFYPLSYNHTYIYDIYIYDMIWYIYICISLSMFGNIFSMWCQRPDGASSIGSIGKPGVHGWFRCRGPVKWNSGPGLVNSGFT